SIIRTNAQPQNLTYRYDYFRNNCATRPRDMLDSVLGGQLHEFSKAYKPTSYRWHALRLMQGDKPLVIGVDIGLGEPSDRPISRWAEMFLPREVHDVLAQLPVRDSTGAVHPFVKGETVLYRSTRPEEPSAPPNLAPLLLGLGGVVAVLLAYLGVRGA